MEELENEKLLKEIKPKFNFIYELLMPTGRKIKSALIMIIISIIITIIISLNKSSLLDFSYNIIRNISLMDILFIICYFMIAFSVIKLLVHITFQKMQYDHISYKFYETYMVYEDDFLNQHKKNILYSNIKEVEIRRTIWDRMIGFGVIVVYTNAENKRNNGLVIYALKNPKEYYEFIDKLINKYRISFKEDNINDQTKDKNIVKTEDNSILEEDIKKERNENEFRKSLEEID